MDKLAFLKPFIIFEIMNCPYCGKQAELKDSSIIYGRSYGLVYICQDFPKCDSFVGVHKGTHTPLGRMANKELREWKKLAHFYFDGAWKRAKVSRDRAYRTLAVKMGLPIEKAHIGMFDVEQCKRVVEIFKQ